MKGKIAFVLGAAVGYVCGTRAGRERYEQIKRGAETVWQSAPVQRGAAVVRDAVDVRVTELKSAATAAGAQFLGNFAQRVQSTVSAKPADPQPAPEPAANTAPTADSASSVKNTTEANPAARRTRTQPRAAKKAADHA